MGAGLCRIFVSLCNTTRRESISLLGSGDISHISSGIKEKVDFLLEKVPHWTSTDEVVVVAIVPSIQAEGYLLHPNETKDVVVKMKTNTMDGVEIDYFAVMEKDTQKITIYHTTDFKDIEWDDVISEPAEPSGPAVTSTSVDPLEAK